MKIGDKIAIEYEVVRLAIVGERYHGYQVTHNPGTLFWASDTGKVLPDILISTEWDFPENKAFTDYCEHMIEKGVSFNEFYRETLPSQTSGNS